MMGRTTSLISVPLCCLVMALVLGTAVQVDTPARPRVLKGSGFNSLKVQCFQANGFKYQLAPLHLGRASCTRHLMQGQTHSCDEWQVCPVAHTHTHRPPPKTILLGIFSS